MSHKWRNRLPAPRPVRDTQQLVCCPLCHYDTCVSRAGVADLVRDGPLLISWLDMIGVAGGCTQLQ